jgi:hypothetical protein
MFDFLLRLEESGIGTWVRESNSLLAYPTILFLHTLGMGIMVGICGFIDLRVLGMARGIPLEGMPKYFGYMWGGFWISLATGIALFIPDATVKSANPVFWAKLGFIAVAIATVFLIRNAVFSNPKKPIETNGKIFALVSIVCWSGAITAGRLLAYIGPGTLYNVQ